VGKGSRLAGAGFLLAVILKKTGMVCAGHFKNESYRQVPQGITGTFFVLRWILQNGIPVIHYKN